MLLASQFHHVGIGDVGDGVAPINAGAGCKVHEVFCAADLVGVATGVVDGLKKDKTVLF